MNGEERKALADALIADAKKSSVEAVGKDAPHFVVGSLAGAVISLLYGDEYTRKAARRNTAEITGKRVIP